MRYINALLTPNQWSRPQKPPLKWGWIVLHWFLAAGQPARVARNWLESRKTGDRGYGSAHVAVGREGALSCVPFDEVAYHVGTLDPTPWARDNIGDRFNYRCLGVELEHDDWTGQPTPEVWNAAVHVAADMCTQFDIPTDHIITHYDVTGMLPKWGGLPCHRWFVEHPSEMIRFQNHVKKTTGRKEEGV